MNKYPKRLIEVDLPIARISAHARREKSIRHGHISTLHIWWARRPLAACRAVMCAALWPDPADENCPQAFRDVAVEQIKAFAGQVFPKKISEESRLLSDEKHLSFESRGRWEAVAAGTLTLDPQEPADWPMLQMCLLDFIADFANWNNSTVPAYLETSRALTQAAHEALGGIPGSRPLVVDPFAGGGSIPLEALRVGADAFASDLNPIPVLLNKVILEYIPKYGQKLADEVEKWGHWIKERAEEELAQFYPRDDDGATPIAYLWARTILSEDPGQGEIPIEVPLMRSFWLSKKHNNRKALRWQRDERGRVECDVVEVTYTNGQTLQVRRPLLEIFTPKSEREVENGTVARGSATCPVTGFTTPVASVRRQLKERNGGSCDSRLFAVVTKRVNERGRFYRLSNEMDQKVAANASRELRKRICSTTGHKSIIPDEPTPNPMSHRAVASAQLYGMNKWSDLFTERQLLALTTLVRYSSEAGQYISQDGHEEMAEAIVVGLAAAINTQADSNSTLCAWRASTVDIGHTFGRQAIPMVWDFVEGNIFSGASRDWHNAINGVLKAFKGMVQECEPGSSFQATATAQPLPDSASNCIFTDPPYYDAVPYADLSDFFYVWLKRTVSHLLPELFHEDLTNKEEQAVVNHPNSSEERFRYEQLMRNSFLDCKRVLSDDGIGCVVFAHKSTNGWEAQLQAIIDAGWTTTASWPIDTEMGSRINAMGTASLASSVHLAVRPRIVKDADAIGEWRDVLSELPKRIHEWMPRLAAEGVVGADAIFSCLGPALEIFSRYDRVEKASGEAVPLREYLEQVWAVVSTEALSMIFRDADAAGLEPDARMTAMWLWTLGGMKSNGKTEGGAAEKVVASSGYTLEYDAARKIAQGLGIDLERSDAIVEVKGDKARLLPVSERTRYLFQQSGDESLQAKGKKKAKRKQLSLFEQLDQWEAEAEQTVHGELKPQAGETVLDRVHQAMILFASGRGEALKRFLVDDSAGQDARFWKLAQSLSALYPPETDEKRWVDGVLARKKGLGL